MLAWLNILDFYSSKKEDRNKLNNQKNGRDPRVEKVQVVVDVGAPLVQRVQVETLRLGFADDDVSRKCRLLRFFGEGEADPEDALHAVEVDRVAVQVSNQLPRLVRIADLY